MKDQTDDDGEGDSAVEGAPVRPLKLALLGCGSVGSQVVRLLHEHADDLTARVGAPIELVGVAVRRPEAQRDAEVPTELLTTDAPALVARDDVDLVVEVIGGIEPARPLILAAMENGASVVTANKALLAEDGSTLFAAAEKAGRDLYFEAAVAGAIPIIRVKDINHAIQVSNGTAYGLSSGVCTDRLDYITKFVDELQVGTVNVWEVPGYRIEMSPFGGIKDSGLGYKEGVLEAMKSFTNVKTYSLPW